MTAAPRDEGRTLWLLRHAKTRSDPPPGRSDFDRVLTPRGRRDATALGRLFADKGKGLGPALAGVLRPAVALVSPAARTSATAELVLAEMTDPPEERIVDDLYAAEPDEVLDILRALPDQVGAAMVVAHNPTVQVLSQRLLAHEDAEGQSLTAQLGFPTCALAVFRFDTTRWVEVAAGKATLLALLKPPY
ncbi:MAG TPA: histidine phosphatase family protein [Acidimicrobiales bacterium]|nr:histidine phosphatase family protein [Acidimicrobiales bacterium]